MPVETPFLTAGITGTGGRIRTRPEDFVVEEIPLYEASGSGTHLYLTIRKKGMSTHKLIDEVARRLGKKHGEVGYAGLKDSRAVTVQRLSVEHVDEAAVKALKIPGAEILKVERHTNKLKPGHLAGNRFVITVREARPGSREDAQRVLDEMMRRGAPNYYGEQRFGRYGTNHVAGKALVTGEPMKFLNAVILPPGWEGMESDAVAARQAFAEGRYEEARKLLPRYLRDEEKLLEQLVKTGDAGRALRALNPQMALFYMNAYQSYLFNKVMARRGMEMIDKLMEGDLAYIHVKGAVFSVKDAAAEAPRAERCEISPSGPIYGKKLLFASGKEEKIERDVLAEEGLTMELFDEKRLGRLNGERRPFRVPVKVDGPVEEPEAGVLVIRFSLPAGAYATNVLREVMKNAELEEDE